MYEKRVAFFLLIFFVFAVSSGLYAIGEKTISLAGPAAWNSAELKDGITEVGQVRSRPVLVLASSGNARIATGAALSAGTGSEAVSYSSFLDLSISFDEDKPGSFRDSTGHYRVTASSALEAVERRFARAGLGAALFRGQDLTGGAQQAAEPLLVKASNSSALFAPGSRIRDFSIEFWLYPFNMENGEQILSWISFRPLPGAASGNSVRLGTTGSAEFAFQRIQCVSSKNRLQWTFFDFFASADGAKHIDITIAGNATVVPKTWSHHLLRFDSATGLIEYMVNGNTESIEYASSTGHEGGEVYSPIAGDSGEFILGSGFMGMIDEFRIYSAWVSNPAARKYLKQGGRFVSRPVDLGQGNSGVVKVEAWGGRTSTQLARNNSDFRENGRFRFSDDSEIQFFIRAGANPYKWDESSWQAFIPGADLGESVRGRYVQIAADFYPSSDGESTPYLEELRIIYIPNEPPLPPASLTAVAFDGGVQLRWKSSPNTNTAGYLIYYGETEGEYMGKKSALGASPIDAGKRNDIVIEGLKNGTLYYFRVAAYSGQEPYSVSYHAGEFSREVRARPLQGLSKGNGELR